jgi:hypothetical protein
MGRWRHVPPWRRRFGIPCLSICNGCHRCGEEGGGIAEDLR